MKKDKKDLLTPNEVRDIREKLKSKKFKLKELIFSKSYLDYFNKTARMVTAKNIKVLFNGEVETAYTSGQMIVINPYLFSEDFEELSIINMGFLAHEIYHILFTDFSVLRGILKYSNPKLLKIVNNILEDSAIEYFGGLFYTGDFKKSVDYLNEKIFEKTEIDTEASNISKIIGMMCNFGSCGKIKGECPVELEELWNDIKKIMIMSRTEPNCKKRFNYSVKITNLITESSFWKNDKDLNSKIPNPKTDNFQSHPSKDLKPMSTDEIKQILDSKQSDSKEKNSKQTSEEKGNDKSSEEKSNTKDRLSSEKNSFESLKESIESELREKEFNFQKNNKEMEKLKDLTKDLTSIDSESVNNKIINVLDADFNEQYETIFHENKRIIDEMTRKLKKILKTNEEEVINKQRIGTIKTNNIPTNLFTNQKVFSKNKLEKKSNLCFTILVDESGSMRDSIKGKRRSDYARETAIIFKELCDNLNIPINIIGFTASFDKSETQHYMYCVYDKPKYKYGLSKIEPKQDNRDGYSICFAGEFIKKKVPKNKKNILIVISDGMPCHRIDYIGNTAIEDTKKMVEVIEKKKIAKVIAINISNSNDKRYGKIYKKSIFIKNLDNLSEKMVNILKKEIKG